MPAFCLPYSLANAEDEERLRKVHAQVARQAPDDGGIGKPTRSQYAGEAGKEFLKVLQAVADQIPVPGVGAAVKIATGLIQACEESHATLERAEELKLRIKTLVTILVSELKGKKGDEIQEKLKQDIISLESDLRYIQTKLDEISSQHALLTILFRSFNEDKVRRCVGRLENALESFSLARQINDTNVMDHLQQQILAFHASHQESLDNIVVTMNVVKAILDERLPITSSSRHQSRSVMPANTSIFHGRDTVVTELVRTLTVVSEGHKRPRVCLLGPGGMGKTSTALAAMAHHEMKECFPDRNQIWVPCVKATSVSLLLDTLYSSLGTRQSTGNTLGDILSELKSSTEPLVLLLDNFETPWNVDGSRSEIEQILYEIEQIAHVAVFITMRSSIPPCTGIRWSAFDLEAVDEDSSRQIYSDIYTEGSDDSKVPELLQLVGHMPLAITLMATIGTMTGLKADDLINDYKRSGTAMLEQGSDSKLSMDICISLSVDSPSMRRHPEAYQLLTTLAMLPIGTTYDALRKWWARSMSNLTGALRVLRETALVKRREMNYFVLPVIRSYILHPSRFPDEVRITTIRAACDFLKQHNSSPGEELFKDHAAALSLEEANLQSMLLYPMDPEPSLIEALLVLARHQLSTRPRLEVIEHTVKLALRLENCRELLGDVLDCYGKTLRVLDRLSDAINQHNLSRQTYLSIPDERRAAQSLLDVLDVYTDETEQDTDSLLRMAEEAKSTFEKLKDTRGIALSLHYIGALHAQNGSHEEGIAFLIRARTMFQEHVDPLNHANCSYFLAQVYTWALQFDDALASATSAVEEYKRLGHYAGDATRILGLILFLKGDYSGALKTLIQCLEQNKSYGRPWDIAQTLEYIGRTWTILDQKADAQSAFTEAMKYYGAIQSSMKDHGMLCCQFFIRALEDPLLVPTDAELNSLEGLYVDFRPPLYT
ncbi:hypothetical protein FPV67DRAFT_995238 [Lyophyllum atratum]|nr:hypothetical protein FPV67DRAFT_995238 [Lyophyllum atratum]